MIPVKCLIYCYWVDINEITSNTTENKFVTMNSTLEYVKQTLKCFFKVEEVSTIEKNADLECE